MTFINTLSPQRRPLWTPPLLQGSSRYLSLNSMQGHCSQHLVCVPLPAHIRMWSEIMWLWIWKTTWTATFNKMEIASHWHALSSHQFWNLISKVYLVYLARSALCYIDHAYTHNKTYMLWQYTNASQYPPTMFLLPAWKRSNKPILHIGSQWWRPYLSREFCPRAGCNAPHHTAAATWARACIRACSIHPVLAPPYLESSHRQILIAWQSHQRRLHGSPHVQLIA